MTRYVVTGGAGFIGSALVRALLAREEDAEVRVIDNLLTGYAKNLEDVRSRISLDESDIRDLGAVAASVRGSDVVFHLAAIPSVPRSIHDPVPSHEVNVDGTFNVFRRLRGGQGAARGVCGVLLRLRRYGRAAESGEHASPPQIPLCGAETDGRILRRRVPLLLRAGNRVAAILQRVWRAAGSFQPVFGRAFACS